MRYNPFRPGKIVAPGMFAGRLEQLTALEKVLFQTKNGNAQHFILTGERGIGKSSLLFYLQVVGDGEAVLRDGSRFSFVPVSIQLEPALTYEGLIKLVGTELKRSLAEHERLKDLAKTAWEFLTRWEAMGVRYKSESVNLQSHELITELATNFSKACNTLLSKGMDGLLLLIDEADKPPVSTRLGEFCKLFTEKLTRSGCNNVSLGLAGLPTLSQKLRDSHESSPRIFQSLSLEPLLPDERARVIEMGLKQATEKNGFEVTITDEAKEMISFISEGYPHFIQQFAYSALEQDTDNVIDRSDVLDSAMSALEQLGKAYFEDLYFDQIASDSYRSVLHAMAEHDDNWVTKTQLRTTTKMKSTILNNALATLRRRNIIIAQPGKKGSYRLPTKSFAVWMKALVQAPSAQQTAAAAGDGESKGSPNTSPSIE